jgi:hypothetical protein
MEQVLFEHLTVTLKRNSQTNYLHLKWRGRIQLDIYKQVLGLCLEQMKAHHTTQFLVDQSELEYVGAEAQTWLSLYWFAEAEKLTQENLYFSIITSKKLFVAIASKVTAQRLQHKNQYSIIHYAQSEAEAIAWLANPTEGEVV